MSRMFSVTASLLLGGALVASACKVGDPNAIPSDGDGGADLLTSVSGRVTDWKLGTPLPDAQLQTAGLVPEQSVISGPDGSYTLEVAPNSTFSMTATLLDYRVTHNPTIAVADIPAILDPTLMSEADLVNQYAIAGEILEPGNAVLVAELVKGDGTPRDLVTVVTLANGLGEPVGAGPFFVGLEGEIDLGVLQSTIVNGKAQVVFLNVPPGMVTLTAEYPQDNDGGGGGGGGGGGVNIKTATANSVADAAVVIHVNGGGGGGGGGGGI